MSDVAFVKRITVGTTDPVHVAGESEAESAIDLLNRCLAEAPRGKILGIEKSVSVINIGEHQVVLQALTYHVGFTRKPSWL